LQTGNANLSRRRIRDVTHFCLLSEVDEFKGAWRALGTLAPERLNALQHVATIESIGSSTRIEGSKLTDREVEKLLSKLEVKKFDSRDEQEVAGYAETMEMIFHAFDDIQLTENHLKLCVDLIGNGICQNIQNFV
jgi:Fic family protein